MTLVVEVYDRETERFLQEFEINTVSADIVASAIDVEVDELIYMCPVSGDQLAKLISATGINPQTLNTEIFVTVRAD